MQLLESRKPELIAALAAELILHVTFPPEYPNVAPLLNVALPEDSPPDHPLKFPEDATTILDTLAPLIDESMGTQMTFTLCSAVKEAAETLIIDRRKAVQAVQDEVTRVEEEKEMEKFRGETVTREVFLEWRARFKVEMAELKRKAQEEQEREDEKKGVKKLPDHKRLTGKELFERGLAGGVEDDVEEDDDDVEGEAASVEEAVEKLKV